MNCAIISLPLPLSPVMKTDASVVATRRAQQLHARRPAHVQVDQDDIERATLQSLERFFPAATYVDLVPFEPERRRTTVAQRVFVIDHKNPHARLHRMVQRKEVRHVASVKRHRGASGSGGRR